MNLIKDYPGADRISLHNDDGFGLWGPGRALGPMVTAPGPAPGPAPAPPPGRRHPLAASLEKDLQRTGKLIKMTAAGYFPMWWSCRALALHKRRLSAAC